MTNGKLQAASYKWRFILLLATFYSLLTLSGCGFQLRGTGQTALPESLSVMRVVVENSRAANDPLLVAMKNALRTQGRVKIEDAPDVPVLVLSNERFQSETLSVRSTGKVSEYLLKYELSFRLTNIEGGDDTALQTIRLRRDYTFDPLNVLAKEKEEQALKNQMRRDAVQQVLRRLSRTAAVR